MSKLAIKEKQKKLAMHLSDNNTIYVSYLTKNTDKDETVEIMLITSELYPVYILGIAVM